MSCSHRARTKSCALVRAVTSGAALQMLVGHERRLRWLAAPAVLVLTFGATASLAYAAPGSHISSDGARLMALAESEHVAGGSGLVLALQRRLAEAGFTPGPVDGRYGPLTVAAVERFQRANGLTVDGIVGSQTLATLTAPSRVIYPSAGAELGASGPVLALQRRLAEAGFTPGPVDGRYGPLTVAAVERFQRANGLTVDGIAGPHTLDALRAAQRRPAAVVHPQVPSVSQAHPIPQPKVAPESRVRERSPAVPVMPVLLGFAVLGLATISRSYMRTRAQVHRARAAARLAQALPALTAGLNGVPAAAGAKHEGSER